MPGKTLFFIVLLMVSFGRVLAQDVPHELLYAVVGNKTDIRSVNTDTGDITQLATLPGTGSDAGLSPDGRYLYLITTLAENVLTLSLTDMNDSSTKHLTDTLLISPDDCTGRIWWSPDSRYVAFLDGDVEQPQMHIYDTVTGTEPKLPPASGDRPTDAPWSPDSRYFAYAAAGNVLEIWDMTTNRSLGVHPAVLWIPDAVWLTPELLAYRTDATETVDVYHVADGSVQSYPGQQILAASPDARYLYVAAWYGDGALTMIDTATGTKTDLELYSYSPSNADWSPDSRYQLTGPKVTRLMDMTDGSERVLAAVPFSTSSVAWNPFGHIVTFSRDDYNDHANGTWIYNLDTGTFKRFNPTLIAQYSDPEVQWSPDGKFLYLLTTDGLKLFDNTAQTLHDFAFAPQGIRWSPDSAYLGFVNTTAGSTLQVMHLPDFSVRSLTGAAEADTQAVQLIGWRGAASMNLLLNNGSCIVAQ